MLQEFYFGWVTVFSKRKGKEKFLRKWTFFFHRKIVFIVYQSTGFGRYNIDPSSLPTAKQSSPGGKLHNEIHNKICLHMQRTLQTPVCLFPDTSAREGMLSRGWDWGNSEDTEGKVRNASKSFPLTWLSSNFPVELLHLSLPPQSWPEPTVIKEAPLPFWGRSQMCYAFHMLIIHSFNKDLLSPETSKMAEEWVKATLASPQDQSRIITKWWRNHSVQTTEQ